MVWPIAPIRPQFALCLYDLSVAGDILLSHLQYHQQHFQTVHLSSPDGEIVTLISLKQHKSRTNVII